MSEPPPLHNPSMFDLLSAGQQWSNLLTDPNSGPAPQLHSAQLEPEPEINYNNDAWSAFFASAASDPHGFLSHVQAPFSDATEPLHDMPEHLPDPPGCLPFPPSHLRDELSAADPPPHVYVPPNPPADTPFAAGTDGVLPSLNYYTVAQDSDGEDEASVGTLRERVQLTQVVKEKRKATALSNKGKKKKLEAEAEEIMARRELEASEFAMRHGKTIMAANKLLDAAQVLKTTRASSASNALNSQAAEYFNRGEQHLSCNLLLRWLTSSTAIGRPTGTKFNMSRVVQMMKEDPKWSIKNRNQQEQQELRAELIKARRRKGRAARPGRLSAAKTNSVVTKRIVADVRHVLVLFYTH